MNGAPDNARTASASALAPTCNEEVNGEVRLRSVSGRRRPLFGVDNDDITMKQGLEVLLEAAGAQSEAGRFIAAHRAGLAVALEDPAALAAALRRLSAGGANEYGMNGRRAGDAQFDRRVVLRQFEQRLEQTVVRARALRQASA